MIKEKISNSINAYADERFNEYRTQISGDVAQSISVMSGVIVVGAIALLSTIFIGLAVGFGLSVWLGSHFYGFGIVGLVILFTNLLVIIFRKKWIEKPVFKLMNKVLRGD